MSFILFNKKKIRDIFQGCNSLEDVCKVFSKDVYMKKHAFPNVYKIYKIAATLAVGTAAGVERSFSSLKIIKDRLRSTMTDERLENLMLIYIHNDVEIPKLKILATPLTTHNNKCSSFYY